MGGCNAQKTLEGNKRNENYDYQYVEELEAFLQSGAPAFIPGRHRDVDRYNWHTEAEKRGLVCKTIKIWRVVWFCENHRRPIYKMRTYTPDAYYDLDEEVFCKGIDDKYAGDYNYCLGRKKTEQAKLKTSVIFNKETSEIVKDWELTRIKDRLVELQVIQKTNSKYWM